MKKDINQMSEDEFRNWLRYTKEGKELKQRVVKQYNESIEEKAIRQMWEAKKRMISQRDTEKKEDNNQALNSEEVQELMKQCENKSKEEVQKILQTSQGKKLIQEMAKTIFPKEQ